MRQFPRLVKVLADRSAGAGAPPPGEARARGRGMEDALVLAEVLAEGDGDTAGARSEARRRHRAGHITKMTDLTSRGAGTPAWLRRILLPRTYRATYLPVRGPV